MRDKHLGDVSSLTYYEHERQAEGVYQFSAEDISHSAIVLVCFVLHFFLPLFTFL